MIGKLVVWGPVVCKEIPGIQTTNLLADLYHVVQLPNKSQRLFEHTELEDIPAKQPLPTLASHWPPQKAPCIGEEIIGDSHQPNFVRVYIPIYKDFLLKVG